VYPDGRRSFTVGGEVYHGASAAVDTGVGYQSCTSDTWYTAGRRVLGVSLTDPLIPSWRRDENSEDRARLYARTTSGWALGDAGRGGTV